MTCIENDGSKDVVAALEEALERARKGELDAVTIITLRDDAYTLSYAWRDDLPHPWAVIVAGLADGQYQLLEDGL
jgi:hypothetical protein